MYGEGATLNTMRWKFHTLRREAELLREEVDEHHKTDTGLSGDKKPDVCFDSHESQMTPRKNGRYSNASKSPRTKSAKSSSRKRTQDIPEDISKKLQPKRKRANTITNDTQRSIKRKDTEVNAMLDSLMEAPDVQSELELDIVDA